MRKTMKQLTDGATRLLALALALGLTARGWADITIPASDSVTGSDETYKYYFAGGTDGDWAKTANWKNADGTDYSGTIAPALESSNTWDPILFDGTRCPDNKSISGSSIEGWGLRMGLYNGVTVEMGSPRYWRNNGYAYVDATSRLRITGSSARNDWVEPVEFVVANTNGIVWTEQFLANVANGSDAKIYYTLIGNGTVCYENRVDGYPSHYIRKVVVTDERPTEKKLVKKTLITFTATGNVTWKTASNATVVLHGITIPLSEYALPSSPTITVNSDVGSCQIVKESNGVYLYYVDGPVQTCTWTPTTVGETVGGLFSDSARWDSTPGLGDDVGISITGDTVLYVDSTKTLGDVSVSCSTATAENPVTLTLQGSGMLTADSVSVPAYVTLRLEHNVLSAPVEVASNATLDFAFAISTAYTWGNVISGSGAVKVSANSVTFSAANTFTGGLTVASGGLAKSSNATGFGSKDTVVIVQSGGTLDVNGSNGMGYKLNIAGTGVGSVGAVINTGRGLASTDTCMDSITLSADATISASKAWGIQGGKYLYLQDHVLTITDANATGYFYLKGIYLSAGTSGNGKICLSNNAYVRVTAGCVTSGNAIGVDVALGCELEVWSACPVKALDCAGKITHSGGAFTCAGAASISGTYNQTGGTLTCSDNLTVGGTININGTLTVASGKTITKSGSGVINIGSSGVVIWTGTAWTSTAGDIFAGTGTLNLSGNVTHTISNSGFEGVLKVTHSGSVVFTAYPAFTGRPELVCDCAYDNKGFFFGAAYAGKSFNVRNLNGGLSYIACNHESATATKVVDTLQTRDTVFNGKFISESTTDTTKRKTGLTVRGEASTGVHSLTLTKENTTCGELTIDAYGKLIFDSTASWANGTVTVADGGYLESKNASAVAATLEVQSGGTIVIPTVTTTANDVTTTSAVALNAGTITFPDSGEATIDISAIPDLEANATVTILTASTSLDSDISKIRLVGKPYALQVSGNNLNVVNDGGLVWDAANSWGTKDATKYDTATITSPGTVALGGTGLVFDTVELTGSGTVSFSATGSETVSIKHLTIGNGVTLDVSSALDLTGCTIAGSGTINVPAGVTYTMSNVACSVKVTVQNTGTLKTSGSTNLSSDKNNFVAGSQFTVEGGSTTSLNGAEKGLSGTITVASGATLVNSRASDSINYNGTTVLNVYGTIAMGATRWSLSDGNTINIYEGAVITGDGQIVSGTSNAGAWDWIANKTCPVNVYGDATISARLRVRSGATVAVAIASGKTLTFSGSYQNYDSGNGSISVSGGVIKLGALNPFVNGNDYSCSLTINDGAAIDINGNKPTNQIYLVGDGPDGAGALINTGANMGSDIAMKITLTGDASWGGSYYTHFGASTDIYLDGYTFTKKGSNYFPLNNTVMRGTGKIVVEEGQFQNNNNNNRLDGIDLEVKTGATLNMAGGTSLRIHDFTCAGTISGTGAKLVVNGTCNVNGAQTIPKLEMVTNSAIAFATTSSKLTANTLTFSLPENGKVLLNVAGLDIPSEGMELINCNSTDNFSVSDGYYLDVVNGSVYAYPLVVNVTVQPIANTTVTVTANGEPVEGVNGVYTVPYGSAVVVTYAAAEGYELSGTSEYTIASATADETIDASGTTVAQSQAAVVDTEGTAHYYPTAQAAVDAVDSYRGMGNEKAYSYFAVFFGTDVAITVDLSKMSWATLNKAIKFKCSDGATISVAPGSAEYELAAGEPDADGIVVYAKNPKATTYFWVGTGSTAQAWGRPALWKVGSAEGDAATRAPSTLDTVAINGGAPISGAGGVTVAAIQIGGTAVVSGDGTLTATTGGIVLTDAAATLTVSGVTLSPTPTTTVAKSYVKFNEDTSTYSVKYMGVRIIAR